MRCLLSPAAALGIAVTCIGLLGCPKSAPILTQTGKTAPGGSASTLALRAASVIYVDFSYTGSDSNGTEARPYLNLTQAVNAAASGDTIRIKGGGSTTSSPETLRVTKPMRIEASGGAVGIGDAAANALVPNVENMTQSAAQAAITAAGLTPGTVSGQYHDTVPAGRVISQNPIAGRIVALGSAVALAVSNGPAPAAPSVASLRINNGATSTASRAVTLNNTCTGSPTQYMASESSTFTGATWKTYAAAPSFTLSSGNGTKTVYFKAKNATGESLPVTDTITLYEVAGVTEETILLPGNVPLTMVWIPAGTFWMGRYSGESQGNANEDPRHQVTVPGFWMGKYELTKRQWKAVMGTEPWSGQTNVLDHLDSPAVYTSWDAAKDFIAALNADTGLTFRLPSESERERAARAGTTTRFYWGDDAAYTSISDYAWWRNNTWPPEERYAHIVGTKLPNAFGLYDMSGNVYEWCEDDWHGDYTGAPADGSAWVDSPRSTWRVLRDGSWYYLGDLCRSAYRHFNTTYNANYSFGFRVARTP